MLNMLLANINLGKTVDVVFVDIRETFDEVFHKRLLQKVAPHGIKDHLYA